MSATAVQATSTAHKRQSHRLDVYDFPKVPAPIYRHAAPSAPWPWMNFDIDPSKVLPIPAGLQDNSAWGHYPQSLFGNWTHDQVNRSQMLTKCSARESSTVYKVRVFDDGKFDKQVEARTVRKDDVVDLRAYWNHLGVPSPSNIRVQALFVEDMTLPVLQMLGTRYVTVYIVQYNFSLTPARYNVEPFFFASSANWIPSRYQEDPNALEDRTAAVCGCVYAVSFLLSNDSHHLQRRNKRLIAKHHFLSQASISSCLGRTDTNLDVHEENKFLFQDLLSLHMVRSTNTSTIISCHPSSGLQGTSAKRLQSLVQRTGDSVYWSKIFERSKDPTFLFLAILWYALYAWDESFEVLFRYINALVSSIASRALDLLEHPCQEYDVLQFNDLKLTQELHKLQARLLYYQQLLRDFLRSVEFVRNMPNPAMNAPSISKAEREDSAKLLRTEADTLITEINRLTRQREMLSARLNNVTHLAIATVDIEESKTMQGLAEVAMKDSAAMKQVCRPCFSFSTQLTLVHQIAYLSMVFLPATYLANVFSMNVREINPPTTETIAHYIVAAVSLTLFTSWPEKMLSLLFSLLIIVFLVLLYGYINDRKLGQLPPEAELVFSPARLTPQGVRAAAEDLSKNPVVMRNILPPKTGRRYIVVGGTGFLGGWIVLQLLERGEDPRKIRILDIRPPTRPDLRTGPAQLVAFLQADVSDAAAVSAAFKAPWPDAEGELEVTVFHTAANIRFYEHHVELLPRSSKVNYDGTINVINASKEIGASTLIYTSSASVSVRRARFWLWPWEKQPPFFIQVYNDDDTHLPKQHDHFFSNYAASKILGEKAVRAADRSSTSRPHTLRTGSIRPGNGIFGPGGDIFLGAYLVRKHNPTWVPNILQSFVYVENCALAHLCYEQRLIELERGSSNPDIGGQAFTVTDAGPPLTFGDAYTALHTLDEETVFPLFSPTLMLGLAQVIECFHVTKSLLSTSDSLIGRAIAGVIPTISGDTINLQTPIFALLGIHLIFDDSRARLCPAKGGLGYDGPYTSLQGMCRTADEYLKSGKNGEDRSMAGGVSFGFGSKKKSKGANQAGRGVVNGVTALN
ncbi:3-beta hydroxysteroid dehydrogenase/isomerase family-domain-containing protein [Lanmaoa asiatica]|nr:3-beta hydroxysteroid dehydrogenase/isomerase family-domain-containing protein [Lanmaoa asiatica]